MPTLFQLVSSLKDDQAKMIYTIKMQNAYFISFHFNYWIFWAFGPEDYDWCLGHPWAIYFNTNWIFYGTCLIFICFNLNKSVGQFKQPKCTFRVQKPKTPSELLTKNMRDKFFWFYWKRHSEEIFKFQCHIELHFKQNYLHV